MIAGAPLRIATRRSALALAQSGQVARQITARTGREAVLVGVDTMGDRSGAPLTQFGGVGVFIAAVREAVLAGDADLAVHSLKDLPTAAHPGMAVLAIPQRAPVEDVLVSSAGLLADLPPGTAVGTGSPRRRAQLLALRPDLRIVGIRGNVDTRLAKSAAANPPVVVLARAGLLRLGLAETITEVLSVEQMLPAPGQGALAIECAMDRIDHLADVAAALDDHAARAAITAERRALSALEAGCAAPMGAHATVDGNDLALRVAVFAAAGRRRLSVDVHGSTADAAAAGARAAAELLDLGAGALLGEPVT